MEEKVECAVVHDLPATRMEDIVWLGAVKNNFSIPSSCLLQDQSYSTKEGGLQKEFYCSVHQVILGE